jgi:hypothetical protein
MNKISASYEIQKSLQGTQLIETEMLGHSRILNNKQVVEKIVEHFPAQSK